MCTCDKFKKYVLKQRSTNNNKKCKPNLHSLKDLIQNLIDGGQDDIDCSKLEEIKLLLSEPETKKRNLKK